MRCLAVLAGVALAEFFRNDLGFAAFNIEKGYVRKPFKRNLGIRW
jgi:hypothetical protein